MRRSIFIIYFFYLGTIFLYSQNLVPNPSFEQHDTCPYTYNQIYFALPWFAAGPNWGSSSDYYNTCSSSSLVNVPNNGWGSQNARTGVAYAGIDFGGSGFNLREYIEVKLNSPLIAGERYYGGFYVNLSNWTKYAVDAFGAYFSIDTAQTIPMNIPMPYKPQIENQTGNIIKDTVNWVLVSGFFTAGGGEIFITIGNFKHDSLANVDTIAGNSSPYGYYYIDDVIVIDSNDTGINEPNENSLVNIFPNPSKGFFTIKNKKGNISGIEILNVLGEQIYSRVANGNKIEVNISDRPRGVYFVKIRIDNGVEIKKIVVH